MVDGSDVTGPYNTETEFVRQDTDHHGQHARKRGGGNSEIEEVSTAPETTKEKKSHKIHLPFTKKTSSPNTN